MILEFQRADRVRDAFNGIGERVRIVVGRIDAPRGAGPVVGGMADAIEHGVPQVDVRGCHVDFRPQDMGSVGEFSRPHPAEEIQVFIDRSGPVRAVFAGLGECAAIFTHLLGRQAVDVGFVLLDQRDGEFVEALEIIRCVKHFAVPVETQPVHIVLNGLDEFRIFGGGVRVVEPQVADSAWVFIGEAEIEANGFRMTDVEVSVRLRREAGDDAAVVLSGGPIRRHDVANEVGWSYGGWVSHGFVARSSHRCA